jgi:hypothetical protein
MEIPFEQVRVLGALIEKERSTPEYYPLTLNSLAAACNQKSNRDPVTDLSESDVQRAIDELRRARLVGQSTGAGSRAEKYRHALAEAWSLGEPELALLAVLMLRGPQTVGELRSRTGRLFAFGSMEAVEEALSGLVGRPEPLVRLLERRAGQKEARWAHLLSGEPAESPAEAEAAPSGALAEEVRALRAELQTLREEFEAFRDAFR